MTGPELQSKASAIYGARWQSALARDMGVNLRSVQRWARDGIGKPITADAVSQFLENRRTVRIDEPPAGSTDREDRDDACRDAIEPAVEALVATARGAGWSEAEILVAVFAAAVDRMRLAGTIAATIETLRAAIRGLQAMRDA